MRWRKFEDWLWVLCVVEKIESFVNDIYVVQTISEC